MEIILIEDRAQRQNIFVNEINFNFERYTEVLSNRINDDFEELAYKILNNDFDLSQYKMIIAHKSLQIANVKDSNSIIISRLKEYCKQHNKKLVLFSGGNPINYYDNSELELLELNSKTFYSQNLSFFLDAVIEENENILMLCYGKNWKQNLIANILEKTNIFINESTNEDLEYSEFSNFIDIKKLDNIKYDFYNMIIENGWVYLSEIKKFRDSIYSYFRELNNTEETKNSTNILIHNNNIFDLNCFSNRIRFKLDDRNIDKYITDEIVSKLKNEEIDKIYIKDNLSTNYLELYGLRVAYHIRLSEELKEKKYLPIIIISDFSKEILMKFSNYSNILFTKNIFLIQNTQEAFINIDKKSISILSKNEYKKDFLNKITIEPPKDYLSHHSIANEWAIYRWADFLKVNTDIVNQNKSKIKDLLYFKYLLAKKPIEKTKSLTFAPKSPTAIGSILFIDDQWDQGWNDILKKYFLNSQNINYDVFNHNYKDENKFTILKDIKNEIILKNPDIVILDLRLTQKDHDEIKNDQDIELLTGIKVLNMLKSINKGIQVIMLTASNQSLILEKLYKYGILGYIKKEHPSDISISTKENFAKLKKLIDEGLENKYLKKIWNIQNEILNLDIFNTNKSDKISNIKLDIDSIFDILDSKMKDADKLVIISFTKILENISSLYINEHTMKYIDDNTEVGVYDSNENLVYDYEDEKWYKNTQNRLHNILYEKLNLTEKSIHINICELINCRNYLAHPNEKKPVGCNLITVPTQEHILNWFDLIAKVLQKMNGKSIKIPL